MQRNKTPRIVAIANQKGGVGKTTTAINLSAGLSALGKRVLIVDLDPQGNATTGLGVNKTDVATTSYGVLMGDSDIASAAVETSIENVTILAATTDLSSADVDFIDEKSRSFLLSNAIDAKNLDCDFIIIDCPPSLNTLTVNALVAADSMLIPLQSEFFALEGLSQLMLSIREVRQVANPDLVIDGIVLTMHDARNRLARQVEQDARDTLGGLVFDTIVPRNVRLSEAPSYALSALEYDPGSSGSQAYLALAKEFLARIGGHDE